MNINDIIKLKDIIKAGSRKELKGVSASPDSRTRGEKMQAAHDAAIIDYWQKRKVYVGRIFALVLGWLFIVLGMVVCQAWEIRDFDLSDAVLISLITTTTANVAVYFYVVAKYLFPYKP